MLLPFLSAGPLLLGEAGLGIAVQDAELTRAVVFQVLVFGGLTAWGVAAARSETPVRWHPAMWLGVAFVAWMAVSTAFGASIRVGLVGEYGRHLGLLTYVTFLSGCYLALQIADSTLTIKRMASVLVGTAGVLAAYGLLQAAGVDPLEWGPRPFDERMASATLGNPDLLGGYLVAALATAIGLFWSPSTPRQQAVYGAGAIVIGASLLATSVRGAWLGALVALGVLSFLIIGARVRPNRTQLWVIAVALAVLGGLMLYSVGSPNADTNVASRLTTAFDTDSGSVGSRLAIWQGSVRAVADDPITGRGPGQFVVAFARHEPPELVQLSGSLDFADNAHNVPLHLAVTGGLPAALLYLLWFGAVVLIAWRSVASRQPSGPQLVLSGLLAGLIGYLAYSLSGIEHVAGSSVAWMVAGLLLAPTARSLSPQRPAPILLATVAFGVLTLLAAIAGVGRFGAEVSYASASRPNTPPGEAVPSLESAVRRSPWELRYRLAYVSALERVVSGEAAVSGLDPSAAFTIAIDQLQVAIAMSPDDFRVASAGSSLYTAAAGSLSPEYAEQAADEARRAAQLRPASPGGWGQLALVLALSGDRDGAIDALSRAQRLWPEWPDGLRLQRLIMGSPPELDQGEQPAP